MTDKKRELGKINVTKKALVIEELENKVQFAVDSYKRAFDKYQRGVDSIDDWNLVVKALNLQMEEMSDYLAVAHHNIGVICATKKNWDKSIEHLKLALKHNPKYPVAHHNLGLVYRKTGDFNLAEKHIAIAKKLGFKKGD